VGCNECWDIIDKAKVSILEWAKDQGSPIFRIEYVATFEDWDNGIEVIVFFDKDAEKYRVENTCFIIKIREHYLHLLEELKYPFDKFPRITFLFDSDENVKKNYEGSYFYRLR